MGKKLLIFALVALNAFTLTNIDAQVPESYQSITFDTFTEVTTGNGYYNGGRDTVYNDLWTFANFNQAYIEINGLTVVANGTPIDNYEFNFQVGGGNHFQLVDQVNFVEYNFTLTLTTFEVGTLSEPAQAIILPNTLIVFGSSPDYDNLEVVLYLGEEGAIETPQAEGGLLELLIGYGIYNTAGLLMLFALVIIIVNIALAFLQVPSIVYIIGNGIITIGFMSVNFIPIWVSFVLLAVLTLFLILSIKGVRV